MPFDHLAADKQSRALHRRRRFCRSELFHMPYDNRMDRGGVRSQCHRVHADRDAHVSDADRLRGMPCEQQLHAQFGGLLRLPPGCLSRHRDDWRLGSESRRGRISNYGSAVRIVPPDHYLVRGRIQSRLNGFPPDE
jgi:hypothetical protein